MENSFCFSLRLLKNEMDRVDLLLTFYPGGVDHFIFQCVLAALDDGMELLLKYHGQLTTGDDVLLLIDELKFYV